MKEIILITEKLKKKCNLQDDKFKHRKRKTINIKKRKTFVFRLVKFLLILRVNISCKYRKSSYSTNFFENIFIIKIQYQTLNLKSFFITQANLPIMVSAMRSAGFQGTSLSVWHGR